MKPALGSMLVRKGEDMKKVRVAIIGASGWMGKVHAVGYVTAPLLFGPQNGSAEVAMIVDQNVERLGDLAEALGNPRICADWNDAVNDPDIDLIDICLPDYLHYEVAMAALAAGKHVYCEKPLCDTAEQARALATLAAQKGVITKVGHNFPKNPAHYTARQMIRGGEIGEIQMFRCTTLVDVVADPNAPFMWRCDGKLSPTGVAGDMAAHLFSIADYLFGLDQIAEISADAGIITKQRPFKEGYGYGAKAEVDAKAEMREVTNPDYLSLLVRLKNGASGIIDASRVATGHKFHLTFDVHGSKGALRFNHDEVNRLNYANPSDPIGRGGWRAIDVGPEVPSYAAFSPLANLGVGYNDYKAVEVAEVINSVHTGKPSWPTF
jgi:predicted dehydrogenase